MKCAIVRPFALLALTGALSGCNPYESPPPPPPRNAPPQGERGTAGTATTGGSGNMSDFARRYPLKRPSKTMVVPAPGTQDEPHPSIIVPAPGTQDEPRPSQIVPAPGTQN